MFSLRPASAVVGLSSLLLAVLAAWPQSAKADPVPPSVQALLPSGATLGRGQWAVYPTEFGKTFGTDFRADTFPGQKPSCDLAAVPSITLSLKGDTAFEQPPMLDMVVADFEQSLVRAVEPLKIVLSYPTSQPNVVSVGEIKHVKRANGDLFLVQFQEDCNSHPKGYKTQLRGLARRGATLLDFTLWIALDETKTLAMADEILANFQKLDIPALTK